MANENLDSPLMTEKDFANAVGLAPVTIRKRRGVENYLSTASGEQLGTRFQWWKSSRGRTCTSLHQVSPPKF